MTKPSYEAFVLAFMASDNNDEEWRRCYSNSRMILGKEDTLSAIAEANRRMMSGMWERPVNVWDDEEEGEDA
jgi:hypothetical protein